MATTVGDIIRSSMRKIGVLSPGEPLPANEGDDALETFTQMVDAWTNETLLIPVVNAVTFGLLAGQSEYTIGIYPEPVPVPLPVNHIETARPERILGAFIRDGSGTDYVQELFDVKTYNRISRKTSSARPSRIYNRKGWPLNTLIFDSMPFADETLHLEVVQPLAGILPTAGLTDVINLPPGYERALIYNLALDLADEWGKQPSAAVATHAVTGKKLIKRNNYRTLVLGMDRAVASTARAKGSYIIQQGP
tara:strand:- start:21681 stop:22430 length:750 start_codon:yes stop_codon:yes gene_type:complete